jgi:hypothetical protein
MSIRAVLVLAAAGSVAALAVSGGTAGTQSTFPLRLSFQKLAPIAGSHYEVWVIDGERKVSAGTFNITSAGKLVTRAGRRASFASPIDPTQADAIAVTIERSPDPSRAPSKVVVLAGKPSGTVAKLRFPVQLGRISGTFLLATPTDDDATNDAAGVWFLRVAGGMRASLMLPRLPAAGWVWEGWGVTQSTPLTSGRFRSAAGADLASPFSGPKAGPAFPGEDFVRNLPAAVSSPVRLNDGSSMIVITLEPDLRGKDPTGPAPFSIKPLVATVAAGAQDHVSMRLRRDLSTVPAGTARF